MGLATIPKQWWGPLKFISYNITTGNNVQGSAHLKPNFVGMKGHKQNPLFYWSLPAELPQNVLQIGIAGEVKGDWNVLVR